MDVGFHSRRYARETGNILSKSSSQSGFTLNETSAFEKRLGQT